MRGNTLIEHGADRLEEPAQRAEAAGGVKAPLAEDAAFLRAGPNPFLIAAAALAVGVVAAKLVDWRGHAHPRA